MARITPTTPATASRVSPHRPTGSPPRRIRTHRPRIALTIMRRIVAGHLLRSWPPRREARTLACLRATASLGVLARTLAERRSGGVAMAEMTAREVWDFLMKGTRTAHVATVRADGRPHVKPVWFVLDGEPGDFQVLFNTGSATVKGRTLRAGSRVALSVDDPTPPYSFVVVEGTAELSSDVAEARGAVVRAPPGGKASPAPSRKPLARRGAPRGGAPPNEQAGGPGAPPEDIRS